MPRVSDAHAHAEGPDQPADPDVMSVEERRGRLWFVANGGLDTVTAEPRRSKLIAEVLEAICLELVAGPAAG